MGKCPEPRKKEKVRREVKMDKCPIVELGVQDTDLKKKEREHLILLIKFQKSKEGMYPLKRAKVELDFHHCYYHHHYTFATHAHLDLAY